MTKQYYYTPPEPVFQFEDRPEVIGCGSGPTRAPFAICNSEAIARFVVDAVKAELKRRAEEGV